jgi:heme oxygenase
VAGMSVAAVVARGGTSGLPERLRAETSQWHEKVEAVADITGRVRTEADYVALLGRLSGLHTGLEAQLCAPSWERAWLGIGVDVAAHCRVGLLDADLAELGMLPTASTVQPPFPCFGQALGCLYVLEGSALGGRMVAGMVRAAIGDVPTAFLTGRGRGHQWPAVRSALRRFDSQGGDNDAVVAGAVSTFDVFARQLAAPALPR